MTELTQSSSSIDVREHAKATLVYMYHTHEVFLASRTWHVKATAPEECRVCIFMRFITVRVKDIPNIKLLYFFGYFFTI